MNGGAFELRSARDLLTKLQHDLDALKADPTNTYLAFNFFVTGHHMKDWVRHRRVKPTKATDRWLLKTCSHLANGLKHFTADERHESVSGTRRRGSYLAKGYLHAGYVARGYLAEGHLIIELQGEAAKGLGRDMITAIDLAKRVFAFWKDRA